MKKLLLSLSLVAILASCTSTSNNDPKIESFNSISKKIKKEFAPDRRDKTYEVELKKVNNDYVIYGSTTETEAKEALVAALKEKKIEAKDSIVLLPDASLGEKTYAVTSSSVACLRYGDDYSSEMATQVVMGTPLRVLEKSSYWLRVQTPEGYIAWVTEGSLQRMNETEYTAWKNSKRMIITNYFTIFYAKPNTNAEVVSDGVWGNIVEYLGVSGNFYCVKLPKGNKVYVKKTDAQDFSKWLATRKPNTENIVKTAKHFVGFPYLWAGTSAKAMDCSGFSKTSYYLNGIILRRDASQQAKTGENIELTPKFEKLQKGDLLFFGSKATEKRGERITHVGIYIEDGTFIHCATTVRINSLFKDKDNYYPSSHRLVRAQRMLGHQDKVYGIVSIAKHPWYFNL